MPVPALFEVTEERAERTTFVLQRLGRHLRLPGTLQRNLGETEARPLPRRCPVGGQAAHDCFVGREIVRRQVWRGFVAHDIDELADQRK